MSPHCTPRPDLHFPWIRQIMASQGTMSSTLRSTEGKAAVAASTAIAALLWYRRHRQKKRLDAMTIPQIVLEVQRVAQEQGAVSRLSHLRPCHCISSAHPLLPPSAAFLSVSFSPVPSPSPSTSPSPSPSPSSVLVLLPSHSFVISTFPPFCTPFQHPQAGTSFGFHIFCEANWRSAFAAS